MTTSSGASNDASHSNGHSSYAMTDLSSSLPGGGQRPCIQLRTKSPLPLFTCPHPIPPASSSIGSTLKLSVLRLLTGEVSLKSSTAPMTESENLKLMTIHGWRMEMIALELRQNVLIAPETRNRIGEGIDDDMEGFELTDGSDCGLLESGDEVLIRLKPAFALPDLHLPILPKGHTYSLPAGALTRAGTLSAPPAYSQANIKRAAEPSSHSSSVQAQPNANYHARQYRDYSKGYRVVTVPTAQSAGASAGQNAFGMTPAEIKRAKASSNPAVSGPSKPLGLGLGVEPPAANPAATQYKATTDARTKRSSSYQKDSHQQQATISRPLRSPRLPASTTASPAPTSPANIPSPSITPASSQLAAGRRPSAQRAGTSGSFSYFHQELKGGHSANAPTSSSTMQQAFGSGGPAGQDAMPHSALVLGPGVQGAIGKASSGAVGQHGSSSTGDHQMAPIAEYGNAKAFAGFTAAGGEVKHRTKQRTTSQGSSTENGRSDKRRPSARSKSYELLSKGSEWSGNIVGGSSEQPGDPARAAVEAAERRAAAARAALNETLASNGINDSNDRGNGSHRKDHYRKVELPLPPSSSPIDDSAQFPRSGSRGSAEEQPSRSYFKGDETSARTPLTAPPFHSPNMPVPNRTTHRAYSGLSNGDDNDSSFVDAPLSPAPHDTEDEAGAPMPSDTVQETAVPVRPSTNRMVSTGGESNVSKKSKKEGRFARLAAPGLGGLGPRRSASSRSVPKFDGQDGDKPTGEMEKPSRGIGIGSVSEATSRLAAPRLGLGPRRQSSKSSVPKSDKDANRVVSADKGAGRLDEYADRAPPTRSVPGGFIIEDNEEDAQGEADENYLDADGNKLSRADRRYLDFQRAYQAELGRQSQADLDRMAEMESKRLNNEMEQKRKEEEARTKRDREKRHIWEEVRKRSEGVRRDR